MKKKPAPRRRRRRSTAKAPVTLAFGVTRDMPWMVQIQDILVHPRRDGRVRVAVVQNAPNGGYLALGLETKNVGARAPVSVRTIEELLGDHGHATLGFFDTNDEAKDAGERFVKARKSVEACSCEAVA
jgi:hypothetical protein